MVVVAGQADAGDARPGQGLAPHRGVDLLVPDQHHLLVARVRLDDVGPAVDLLGCIAGEALAGLVQQAGQVVVLELVGDGLETLHPAGLLRERPGLGVIVAHGLGDLGEVPHLLRRHDRGEAGGDLRVHRWENPVVHREAVVAEHPGDVVVERGDAVVVERGRGRAEHRHVVRLLIERLAVADELSADVAQGILGSASLELVDGDDIGEVEHVDLLQLRRGTELRRHHVHRAVDERDDAGVALADARGLDDDEVEAGGLQHSDDVIEVVRVLVAAAGGQRPEVDAVAVQGIHPDAVTEQRAATLASRRVDGEHGDAELVLLVGAEPADELVGERALAGAAGAGDAEQRDVRRLGRVADGLAERVVEPARLRAGDGPGDRVAVSGQHRFGICWGEVPQVVVASLDDLIDHPRETETLTVLGREDGDPGLPQPGDLLRHDHAATTAEDLDVIGTLLAQRLDEVLEELDVPALVGAHCHALDVLLQGCGDDLADRAVVPEVDDLRALRLQDAPHDVDARVVPVEQRGRRDEANGMLRLIHRTYDSRTS